MTTNETGLFQIMEEIHKWHNAKMCGEPYTPAQVKWLREKIIELAGFDLGKLDEIRSNIDGCCFSICQGENPDVRGEVEDIDHYSTLIEEMIATIGD